MRKNLGFALALVAAIVSNSGTMAQTQAPEQKIWALLDDSEAAGGERQRAEQAHDRPGGERLDQAHLVARDAGHTTGDEHHAEHRCRRADHCRA